MNRIVGTVMVAAALFLAAGTALAGAQLSEQRAIDARVVKVVSAP
jgi:hypothetical protein